MTKKITRLDFYRDVAGAVGIANNLDRIEKIEMCFASRDAPRMVVYFVLEDEDQEILKEVIKRYKWVEEQERKR